MAGFATMNLKRKDLEEVNDDFVDFSLSSPARKIRRLDAELPPIIEEEETELPYVLPEEHSSGSMGQVRNLGPIIEELPTEPENNARAIVLFKPMNTPLIQSPSSFSVSVDPHILSHLKTQFCSRKSKDMESAADESGNTSSTTESDTHLALVPWAPSQIPSAPETEVSEMMDAEDMGEASMDIEQENDTVHQWQPHAHGAVTNSSEALPQWQQHCWIPQLPQNTSALVTWYQ